MESNHKLVVTLTVHEVTDGKRDLLLESFHGVRITHEQLVGNKEKTMAPFPAYVDWKLATLFRNVLKENYISNSTGSHTEQSTQTESVALKD
jgi:hypothetical protein